MLWPLNGLIENPARFASFLLWDVFTEVWAVYGGDFDIATPFESAGARFVNHLERYQ
jgi:hypothetical protein